MARRLVPQRDLLLPHEVVAMAAAMLALLALITTPLALPTSTSNDVIIGGRESDRLFGDDGNDVFVFRNAGDSTLTDTDLIMDFVSSEDLIDLSQLVAGTLTMDIGGSASGTGPSAWTRESGAGDTIIRIDLDGDGVEDMRIDVDNVLGLTESDFIL